MIRSFIRWDLFESERTFWSAHFVIWGALAGLLAGWRLIVLSVLGLLAEPDERTMLGLGVISVGIWKIRGDLLATGVGVGAGAGIVAVEL